MRSKNNFSNISLFLNKLNSYAEDNNYVSNLHLVIEKIILINLTQKLFLNNNKIGIKPPQFPCESFAVQLILDLPLTILFLILFQLFIKFKYLFFNLTLHVEYKTI